MANHTDENQVLVLDHMSFASQLAEQFYRQRTLLGISLKEYEAAAFLGLCQAAQTFDLSRGLCFRTFSFYRIKGAMSDLLRRMGPVCYSHLRDRKRLGESDDTFDHPRIVEDETLSSIETEAPISSEVEFELTELEEGENHEPFPVRVSIQLKEVLSLPDRTPTPEAIFIAAEERSQLLQAISQLRPLDQDFLHRRYFEECSLNDIRLGRRRYSKSGLCRIHRNALKRLKRKLQNLQAIGWREAV